VGIEGIGNSKKVFAYRVDVVNEVGNFTDFFQTTYILSVTIDGRDGARKYFGQGPSRQGHELQIY
jgi:hypothetical protein